MLLSAGTKTVPVPLFWRCFCLYFCVFGIFAPSQCFLTPRSLLLAPCGDIFAHNKNLSKLQAKKQMCLNDRRGRSLGRQDKQMLLLQSSSFIYMLVEVVEFLSESLQPDSRGWGVGGSKDAFSDKMIVGMQGERIMLKLWLSLQYSCGGSKLVCGKIG